MTKEQVLEQARALFDCDKARISSPTGRHFLIIGETRNTRDERGCLGEKAIASGNTMDDVHASMLEYHRLCNTTWEEYFAAFTSN